MKTAAATASQPAAEPLRVTYQVPLPHDGAVSGFAFRLGDRRVVTSLQRSATASPRDRDRTSSTWRAPPW